ncbi:hypothetical protein [Yoonia sp. BS5-3]|uniref:Uncharacterized protein n=1 Tax=Yoonia phaeophyticola TaxID=3137369 RepID=A0ABZ2V7S8_9RHOB
MLFNKPTQILAFVAVVIGTAYCVLIGAPRAVRILFVLACIGWSAWHFISIFRGRDEVVAAGIKYALAFASGVGVPCTCLFVVLMIETRGIQNEIASLASYARSGLHPAAAGFGMGVTFTMLTLTLAFVAGVLSWWAAKR